MYLFMEQLDQILEKLSRIDAKVTAIDLSITGDPSRGVDGMKQHVEKLKIDFHQHTISDHETFSDISGKMKSFRGWIAGATFVVLSGSSIIAFLITSYIKTNK